MDHLQVNYYTVHSFAQARKHPRFAATEISGCPCQIHELSISGYNSLDFSGVAFAYAISSHPVCFLHSHIPKQFFAFKRSTATLAPSKAVCVMITR